MRHSMGTRLRSPRQRHGLPVIGQPECRVEGCEKEVRCKGLCQSHYMRQWRHGTATGGGSARYATPEASFAARTKAAGDGSGCVNWTGSKASTGHGVFASGPGRTRLAYRYSWEQVNGPVPEGMILDHACRNPSCVNVEHLRLADKSSNGANRTGAEAGRKYHLPRGVYPSLNKYQVKIQHRGKQYYLGTFETVEEAESASQQARAEFFKEFAGLGSARTSPVTESGPQ